MSKRLSLFLLALVAIAAVIGLVMHADLPNTLADALDYFQRQQRLFHDTLADDMHRIHDTGDWLPALGLIGIGFLYGAFHAVGPGHGKIIVTSYMLASRRSLSRGLVVVLLSSLLQAVVAIIVVLGLFYALGLARSTTEHAANVLETVSFGLIAVVGARLFWRGVREARTLRQSKPHVHHHHHDDHHHHDHAHHDCGHDHVHDEHCGHAHMPTPAELASARGWGEMAVMIISIGIRPCSGAIILLLFACLIGVVGPGIAATFAMAGGTALTTGLLAIAAVTSRNGILRLLKASDKTLGVAHAALGIVGGALVILLGLFFLAVDLRGEMATLDMPAPTMPLMHLPSAPPQ